MVLTARNQIQDRLQGYQTGADNYLIKPVEQAEMLACINSLAMRIKPPVREVNLVIDGQSLKLQGPSDVVTLTHHEYLLLAAFCRAAGNKLERWQAMQLIDPTDKGLVGANLEMRISALRKKLAACGAPDDAEVTLRLCCQSIPTFYGNFSHIFGTFAAEKGLLFPKFTGHSQIQLEPRKR